MKIVLLKGTVGLGKAGQVVDVADGYARNFILPRGIGIAATVEAVTKMQLAQRAGSRRNDKAERRLHEAASLLAGVRLTFHREASASGTLFAGVTATDVLHALIEQSGLKIPTAAVALGHALKTIGEFPVRIKLGGQQTTVMVRIIQKE